MKHLITSVAVAALLALPAMADAQGKGNGKGNGKGHVVQNAGNGHGNGNGNGHGNGNGKKADKDNKGHRGNDRAAEDAGRRYDAGHANPRKSNDVTEALLRTVTGLTAANGVIYLTPDVDFATITDEDLQSIANCPPGLAKKDPPCVPPGLAKKGVGFNDWASYDQQALRGLLDDRFADVPTVNTTVPLDLTQERIADIFGLAPAPDGYRYAVIDGRPVQLNDADYNRLLTLNSLAERPTLADGVAIVPDAALTQDQLVTRYGLPALAAGQNYSVLDNQIIALPDQSYDMLQLIRILGAV
ncbi:MAG: hypothetical protein KKB02_08165 [Alphaproteobacteria bacterium]|nr:hypothetical protein [Alphaproteobacteria bacterium]